MNKALNSIEGHPHLDQPRFLRGSARILVVDDDAAFSRLLTSKLRAEGFIVDHIETGDEANARIAAWRPDLVIMDWMLPGLSGLEICRQLRDTELTRSLPVIMLSTRGDECDRVLGLETADDYVVKPVSMLELVARVHALLRRVHPDAWNNIICIGEIEVDRRNYRVLRSERRVHLAPTEFRLLTYLMEKPGRVFSRSALLDNIWGLAAGIDERTVDVYVGRLRRSLSIGAEVDPIRTVRGAGYAFDETFSASAKTAQTDRAGLMKA